MSLKYSEKQKITSDQSDMFRMLTPISLFRLMQSSATNFSKSIKSFKSKEKDLNKVWLAYYTKVEFYDYISYGNSIDITTWLDDVRRANARRMYEIINAETKEKIASAFTDWIYYDKKTQKPIAIETDFINTLFIDKPPEKKIKRIKLNNINQTKSHFKYTQKVMWRHLDMYKHVNNTNYLEFFDDCFCNVHDEIGQNLSNFLEKDQAWYPIQYEIQYHTSALLSEELIVIAQIEENDEREIIWHFELKRKESQNPITKAKVIYRLRDIRENKFINIDQTYRNALKNN